MGYVFENDKQDATSRIVRGLAPQSPTTFTEGVKASFRAARQELSVSERLNLESAYEPVIQRLNEGMDAEQQLHNPYGSNLRVREPVRVPTSLAAMEDPGQSLETRVWDEIQRRRQAGDELPDLPQTREELHQQALATARQTLEQSARELESATGGGQVGALVGGFAGAATDPALWPTFFVGAPASAGILRTAVIESMIGGATEAALQPLVAEYRNKMGLDYTREDFLRNVGFAAGASGVFGGTIRAAGKGVERVLDSMRDHRATIEAFDQNVENPTVEQRAARDDLEATVELDEKQPEAAATPQSEEAHHQRYVVADKATRDGERPPVDEVPPDARSGTASDPQGGLERVNPDNLRVDARRFQFKATASQEGVTERLQGVTTWDESKAGVAVVWENEAGEQFIADGHQRLALARRLREQGQDDIRLNAIVLRESEGITDAEARVIAASKNIAEGTGSPIDAAKVLREAGGDESLTSLPPQSALVRQGRDLVNLGDDAFGAVVNEIIPAHYGAIVGRLVDDENLQRSIVDLLAREQPANAAQAESIVRQAREVGLSRAETQESLFGEEEVTRLLFRERAQVLDKAMTKLRRDKRAFKTLVDQARDIEAAGNRLSTTTNARRAASDGEAINLVQRLAHTRGPISDALAAAASRADREGRFDRAVDDFLDTVRREIEAGNVDGSAVRTARRSAEPADQDAAVREQAAQEAQADQERLTGFDEPGGEGSRDAADALDAEMRPRDQRQVDAEEPQRDQAETADRVLDSEDALTDDAELGELLTAEPELFEAANTHRAARGLEPFESPDEALDALDADLEDMLQRPSTQETIDEATRASRREEAIATLADRGGLAEGQPGARISRGRRADIVIGPPAAGKSSALVDPLARHYESMVIDADEAKQLLPEYDGGRGANAVHEESSEIAAELMNRALDRGSNIVYPKVGKTRENVEEIVQGLQDEGYDVFVHLVDLPPRKTMQRMLLRYVSTGRLLPPAYVQSIGRLPRETFDATKEKAQGWTAINNDVPPGEPPRATEQGGAAVLEPDVYPGSRSGARQFRDEDAAQAEGLTEAEEAEALELADMHVPVGERVDDDGDTVADTRTVRELFAEADEDARFADEVEACAQ